MKYKIVVDSCCDLKPEEKADPHFQIVSLTLSILGKDIIDDETFDQAAYLAMVASSKEPPHTACPSPEAYRAAYEEGGAECVYVVTLSQHLSGSYNSAVVGAQMLLEEKPDVKIHVFSSDSACVGESLIALKIRELCEAGLSFEEVVEQAGEFRDKMNTFFVLESLDALKKNGRLTGLAALVVTALNIKPVMAGNHGIIEKLGQARGIQKALEKMISIAQTRVTSPETKTLGITHCNCPERALWVRDKILEKIPFRNVYLVDAAGVASTYASDGGIVVCF
ncbi:MAG: DegV family protein [Lachnospiraceae bacterium]|nr:DegV family protein [Lachnospiraceae bacterium]